MEMDIHVDLMYLRHKALLERGELKDMNSKDLMKFLLRTLRETKIPNRKFEARSLKTIGGLDEIGKTSKSIGQQCGLVSSEKDASAVEDKMAESSPEISVRQERKFRVLMDASNFRKGEVDVRVHKNYLVIHGKHGTVADDHGTISREFTRKIAIPEDVDVETFAAHIDVYRVLAVEASFKPAKIREKTLVVLKETCDGKAFHFQPYKDLEQFKELVKGHIDDGKKLKKLAQNFAKQCASDHVPVEIV